MLNYVDSNEILKALPSKIPYLVESTFLLRFHTWWSPRLEKTKGEFHRKYFKQDELIENEKCIPNARMLNK